MTILVSTDAWIDELTTRLPGISSGQLGLELRSTLREFFTTSSFWVEELNPINITVDKDLYKLSYPQAKVMGVQAVWLNGSPLTLLTIKPKTHNPNSAPGVTGAYMAEHDLMQLFPVPIEDGEDALQVYVRLNPLPEMTKVPVETVSHFFDAVLDGVLGRLYGQPGKPYTNLLQSTYHLRRFRDGMALARDMGRKRYSAATTPWQFPGGWA